MNNDNNEVETYEGLPEGRTSHPAKKRGLYCSCGKRIKKGTMLAHWGREHPGTLHQKAVTNER